jgi:signal transduction histidine kinase
METNCVAVVEGDREIRAMVVDVHGLRHGNKVVISVSASETVVAISIEDDGPSVPADALACLGAPFQRFDPSRSRETGGAGLGLAIVQTLVERDRGSMRFGNVAPHGLRGIHRYSRGDIQPPAAMPAGT